MLNLLTWGKELLIRISVEIRQFTVDKEFDVS